VKGQKTYSKKKKKKRDDTQRKREVELEGDEGGVVISWIPVPFRMFPTVEKEDTI